MTEQVKNYHGWRFCPYCENLLKPFHGGDSSKILQFKCRNLKCGENGIIEVELDPQSREDALLLKKDYQAAKAIDITDTTLILDPSMPRKSTKCSKLIKTKKKSSFNTFVQERTFKYVVTNGHKKK